MEKAPYNHPSILGQSTWSIKIARETYIAPTFRINWWGGIPGSFREFRKSGVAIGWSVTSWPSSSIQSLLKYECVSPGNRPRPPNWIGPHIHWKGSGLHGPRRFQVTDDIRGEYEINCILNQVCMIQATEINFVMFWVIPMVSKNWENSGSDACRIDVLRRRISKCLNTSWVRIEAFAIAVRPPTVQREPPVHVLLEFNPMATKLI